MTAPRQRVLLVDDNADLRRTLQIALELSGYQVRAAANGSEALRMLEEAPADVVVTDIFMPELDGFETIDKVRAKHPTVTIVVMSGDARQAKGEYLPVAEMMGVHATLRKPVAVEDLVRVLEGLVR